jgi:hypothetical protein
MHYWVDSFEIEIGDIVVMTEVLEHLTDPYQVLERLRRSCARRLICSSPSRETAESHCGEHAWAWDMAGYAEMITEAGWQIDHHAEVGGFQLVSAR